MSKRKYWQKQASNLTPVKTHICEETGDTFYFVHKTIADEELATRISKKYRKDKGSKQDPSTNEYLVTLYMVLECDEKGKRERDKPMSKEFAEELDELIDNPAFAYHLNGALKAIGEAPDGDEDGAMKAAKKSSSPEESGDK